MVFAGVLPILGARVVRTTAGARGILEGVLIAKSAIIVAGSTALASLCLSLAAAWEGGELPALDLDVLATSGLSGATLWGVALGWAAYRKWTTLVEAQLAYYTAENKHREDSGEHRELHREHWRRVESALTDLRHRAAS